MKSILKQKNNILKTYNKGFTLVETLVAIFILTIALNAFFGIIATSLFSARYAQNEITANYLLQEVVDYVRNDRDTYAFQKIGDVDGGWVNFLSKYGYGGGPSLELCFVPFSSNGGCEIEPADTNPLTQVISCSTPTTGDFGTQSCRRLNYDENAVNKNFYTYKNDGVPVNFKRQVIMSVNPGRPDELDIRVTVEWKNGNLVRSRSLQVSLLNWQQ
jgi:prepilin-type N-terminal cleavage/methylation domain-containing protein